MKKEYLEENKLFLKSFLNSTFFKNWKASSRKSGFLIDNYGSLEMNIGHSCDLNCKYCYYNKYGHELYQEKAVSANEVLNNTEKLMNFMYKNEFYANYELFAGEPFVLSYIWDFFDIVHDYLKKTNINKRTRTLQIPTNLSFFKDEFKLEKLKQYIEKYKSIDVDIGLSGSFDGPFMDPYNRPHASGANYDKEFYDNYIKLCNELNIGAHPMIYSNNIEHWIDNFLWMSQNTPHLYLLDVRNWEWSVKDVTQLFYLMRFMVNHTYNHTSTTGKDFFEFIKSNHGFNILMGPISKVGRGLGCSIQATLDIQLHNLELVPCHRLGYKNLSTGNFIFEDDGSWDFNPKNVELYVAEQVTDSKSISPCSSCPINNLCSGTCLGANYEATGDTFTVPPSFCRESSAKVAGILKGFQDIGYIDRITQDLDLITRSQISYILDAYKEL